LPRLTPADLLHDSLGPRAVEVQDQGLHVGPAGGQASGGAAHGTGAEEGDTHGGELTR
jgi:hypothetical protein